MQMVTDNQALREAVQSWRAGQCRVAFVPTMGSLHAGHLRLVEVARDQAERVVVSIFVNPTQFAPGEDYASYPRALAEDRQALEELGVDLLYTPTVETLYPHGPDCAVIVDVPELSDQLCGAFRPGHFRGVATVVAKLLNIVQPDMAVFGEKDYQQLLVIRRMAEELFLSTDIVGVPTVREADGLALSSRNQYLTAAERRQAPALYRTLLTMAERLRGGETDYAGLESQGLAELQAAGLQPEYCVVRRAEDLGPPQPGVASLVVLAAAYLGRARLIDNVITTLD